MWAFIPGTHSVSTWHKILHTHTHVSLALSLSKTAHVAKRSYGCGADASGGPGLSSSTGEDKMLGVVAMMAV